MAISKNFLTDTVATGVITQTIEKINALIPGVTVKSELSGMVGASVAEYFYNLAPNITTGDAGADFSATTVGSKKAVMPLTRALQMDEKVPGFAIETTGADVLNDRLAKGAVAIANKAGQLFITDLLGLAQAKSISYDDHAGDFYKAVVKAIEVFSSGSSAKVGGSVDTSFSNAANGIQPKTLIVGDVGRSKLFKTDAFQRIINATGQIGNLIGTMLGLQVVYSQHLSGVDFVLLNPEGVAYPFSLNTLRVIESELFNGVRVQGEVVIPDVYSGSNGYSILPVDSFAMKFTMAAQA